MSRRISKEGGPHPVDIHVGHRLRIRRAQLGMSQPTLGDRLGITFQQIQKYERGANRVSASTLFEIARAMDIPISYFFDGLSDAPTTPELPPAGSERQRNFLASREGQRLIDAMSDLPKSVRDKITSLAVAARQSNPVENDDD